MMGNTKIEWADKAWNPVTGCTKVSTGCKNCYAETMSRRFGWPWDTAVTHPDRLVQPLRWRNPRRVFVCSMGDLFHEDVPDGFINRVWHVMYQQKHHRFLVLTKRPQRMREFLTAPDEYGNPWTVYPNIWLGVSVEDQATADERIPALLQTPAAVRFVSVEPMLGPVDLDKRRMFPTSECFQEPPGLDWVICGGESGPGARPMHPDWARSLLDQCSTAGVPFFFKQWGEWAPPCRAGESLAESQELHEKPFPAGCATHFWADRSCSWRIGKKKAGNLLDGERWEQYPEAKAERGEK